VANPDGIPLFTFLDGENNEVTDNLERGRIRTVILTLTVEEPAGIKKTMSRTYSSRGESAQYWLMNHRRSHGTEYARCQFAPC